MAALTIRNIDDDLKQRLRLRAAENNRSMEEEARILLRKGIDAPNLPQKSLGAEIRELVARYGPADDLVLLEDQIAEPMTFE